VQIDDLHSLLRGTDKLESALLNEINSCEVGEERRENFVKIVRLTAHNSQFSMELGGLIFCFWPVWLKLADVKGKTVQEWQWSLTGNEKYSVLCGLPEHFVDILPASKRVVALHLAEIWTTFRKMYDIIHEVKSFGGTSSRCCFVSNIYAVCVWCMGTCVRTYVCMRGVRVCRCVRACVRVCVRACTCACAWYICVPVVPHIIPDRSRHRQQKRPLLNTLCSLGHFSV
jgi:hypothetical protein